MRAVVRVQYPFLPSFLPSAQIHAFMMFAPFAAMWEKRGMLIQVSVRGRGRGRGRVKVKVRVRVRVG